MNKSSPIFTKTYDFLHWIIPITAKFPRHQRFILAQQIQQTTFGFHANLVAAAKKDNSLQNLRYADIELVKLRTYIRLSHDLQYLTSGQFEHGAKMLVEIGKLLGKWLQNITESKI